MFVKKLLIVMLMFSFALYGQQTFAQDTKPLSKKELRAQEKQKIERAGSMERQDQVRQDNADALNKEYKQKARIAKNADKDARDAHRQAKRSSNMEKKAQKARVRAEKQVTKAAKAAKKSDDN
jgi:hypothetical protein